MDFRSRQYSGNVLDLGCGRRKLPGAVGIDINPESDADIIHDLNVVPYPFPENQFDVVLCLDILEHLDNIVRVMEEVHRISRPGARIEIHVPSLSSAARHVDPTHRHAFTSRSFDYFIKENKAAAYGYSKVHFDLEEAKYTKSENHTSLLDRFLLLFVNKHKVLYESRLAYYYQTDFIHLVLKTVKE